MENQLPFNLETINSLSKEVVELLTKAYDVTSKNQQEYITPEHVLLILTENEKFKNTLYHLGKDIEFLKEEIINQINDLERISESYDYRPGVSYQLLQLIMIADNLVSSCGKSEIGIHHIIKSIFSLNNSWAQYLLSSITEGEEGYFLSLFLDDEIETDEEDEKHITEEKSSISENNIKENKIIDWKKYVVCLNEIYKDQNPLIGREEELKKTIRVLCRKDKNNPILIGEPGVGKTSLIYGLADMIERGDVPERLKKAKIYLVDLGGLIAGTQYRGDFEMKLKKIMDGASKEENSIIYIDEIHNLVGAGAVGESSMDASNMLKPYLEKGNLRFIGATTYDEYKRYFARSKSIVRRFTNIDILEPSIQETISILRQLQGRYEDFHKVKYTDEAIEYAAKGSARHINDRFLPDKAIDLIDESGAEKQLENTEDSKKIIDKEDISEVLAKICKVDSISLTETDPQNIEKLEERISQQLFGQSKAVSEVSEAILMSKAGLNDENKPLASLLFVGPTGVGKTELAKLLAKELGIELIRFDMSEYSEKHAVAKLIGSPAGYVGYEDGGLLTDAIRKTPNAVLLLDEIEKAHDDIYNILLQVMDYAKLTDNKGNKADFRNVVLIMTSNAGAQFASHANVGFASNVTQGDAMLKHVKKTFKPEFINRLSATVVFNDMSKEMASLILDKKLKELGEKLKLKNVKMTVGNDAKEYLLNKGFTKEYGARELDRVIHHELKRILMKEILSGSLKDGGYILVKLQDKKISLCKN